MWCLAVAAPSRCSCIWVEPLAIIFFEEAVAPHFFLLCPLHASAVSDDCAAAAIIRGLPEAREAPPSILPLNCPSNCDLTSSSSPSALISARALVLQAQTLSFCSVALPICPCALHAILTHASAMLLQALAEKWEAPPPMLPTLDVMPLMHGKFAGGMRLPQSPVKQQGCAAANAGGVRCATGGLCCCQC